MKKFLSYSVLAAAAASGFSLADTATTKPVGYVTQTLVADQFNVVGLSVQKPIVASGKFETISGVTLTDSDVSFASVLESGKTYILEIISASSGVNGVIQEVVTWSGNSLTTQVALGTSFGLTTSDSYSLRQAPTIEEIFGTTTSILSKGPNAASGLSDVIWVSDGPGVFSRYYIRSSDNTVRNAQTNAAAPGVPIVYVDGLLVQKKTTGSANLIVSGEVKTTATVSVLSEGFNLLGTVYPASATLQNSGLAAIIGKGPNAASPLSDIIWVATTPGSFDRYYLRSSDSTWRNAQTNAAIAVDVPLSSGIFVQKKSAGSVNATLTPPPSYSGL